jgi:hypothetical protein
MNGLLTRGAPTVRIAMWLFAGPNQRGACRQGTGVRVVSVHTGRTSVLGLAAKEESHGVRRHV